MNPQRSQDLLASKLPPGTAIQARGLHVARRRRPAVAGRSRWDRRGPGSAAGSSTVGVDPDPVAAAPSQPTRRMPGRSRNCRHRRAQWLPCGTAAGDTACRTARRSLGGRAMSCGCRSSSQPTRTASSAGSAPVALRSSGSTPTTTTPCPTTCGCGAYCGHYDEHSEFITRQQLDRAKRAAADWGVQMVRQTLDRSLRRIGHSAAAVRVWGPHHLPVHFAERAEPFRGVSNTYSDVGVLLCRTLWLSSSARSASRWAPMSVICASIPARRVSASLARSSRPISTAARPGPAAGRPPAPAGRAAVAGVCGWWPRRPPPRRTLVSISNWRS